MLQVPTFARRLLLGTLLVPAVTLSAQSVSNTSAADPTLAPAIPTPIVTPALPSSSPMQVTDSSARMVTSSLIARPVGLTRATSNAPAPAPKVPRAESRSSTALMITGLAAIVVGAVVDDNDASSILIVGGAVVGLIGLYKFLQ